jgi:hypothetical protein
MSCGVGGVVAEGLPGASYIRNRIVVSPLIYLNREFRILDRPNVRL